MERHFVARNHAARELWLGMIVPPQVRISRGPAVLFHRDARPARQFTVVREPRRLPAVLSVGEVTLRAPGSAGAEAQGGACHRRSLSSGRPKPDPWGDGLREFEVVALKIGDIDPRAHAAAGRAARAARTARPCCRRSCSMLPAGQVRGPLGARFAERGEGLINAPDTDPHHQGDLVVLAKSIRDELGVTILFSAHELNPLLGALDRVLYFALGQAALGAVDDVITGPVRSRLYGAEIDVVRPKGRIFIMSGGHDVERNHCRRDNGSRDTHIRRLLGAQPSDV
jgi:hypothetical protein